MVTQKQLLSSWLWLCKPSWVWYVNCTQKLGISWFRCPETWL